MASKPILFSGEMVNAILQGRKTVTRRVIKPREIERMEYKGRMTWTFNVPQFVALGHCPYGIPGDTLWVRETFTGDWRGNGIPAPGAINYRADGEIPDKYKEGNYWRPSIFMPRWASRITLEVTDVRVERLQEISRADILAEGIAEYKFARGILCDDWHPQKPYADLWDKINGAKYPWETNPFVWIVTFNRT